MDLNRHRQPLDAPGIPEVDGELASQVGPDGRVQVEVIEHLRVKVPAAARLAWYEAEQASWEPWLRAQVGFLGRELRWDQEREEGQLLIRWASREQWHAIPRHEIEQVQERFERHAHAALERLGVLPSWLAPSASPCSQAQPVHTDSAQAEPFQVAPSLAAATQPVPSQAGLSQAVPSAAQPAQAEPSTADASAPQPAPQPVPAGAPANPFPLVYSGELAPEALPERCP